MRKIVAIIICLVAIATAAPQYNYDQGLSGTQGIGSVGGGGIGGGLGSGGFVSGVGGGLIDASGNGFGSLGAASGGNGQFNAPTVYNKQFYIHSAPEDEYDRDASNQINNLIRRNLRVVFIKSPENKGLENAALQLAKTASEDRTAIYVLNKQTDLNELQGKLSQIQDLNAAKPEVHFIKYKTPQEAEHAQHSIQAQYDQLGGATQVSHEGVAPVRNFIGSLGGAGGASGGQGSFISGSAGQGSLTAGSINRGSAAYLPPLHRFRH